MWKGLGLVIRWVKKINTVCVHDNRVFNFSNVANPTNPQTPTTKIVKSVHKHQHKTFSDV